jgi:hypothetical protein
MSEELKPGDRVRLRIRNHPHGYRQGDTGTVLRVATRAVTGEPYYLLAMDGDGPDSTGALVHALDVEPDG